MFAEVTCSCVPRRIFCCTQFRFTMDVSLCPSKSFVLAAARHCELVITSRERRFDVRRARESLRFLPKRSLKLLRSMKSRNPCPFVRRHRERNDRTRVPIRDQVPRETVLQRTAKSDENLLDGRFESREIHATMCTLNAAESLRLMGRSTLHSRTRFRK